MGSGRPQWGSLLVKPRSARCRWTRNPTVWGANRTQPSARPAPTPQNSGNSPERVLLPGEEAGNWVTDERDGESAGKGRAHRGQALTQNIIKRPVSQGEETRTSVSWRHGPCGPSASLAHVRVSVLPPCVPAS